MQPKVAFGVYLLLHLNKEINIGIDYMNRHCMCLMGFKNITKFPVLSSDLIFRNIGI